MGTVTSDLRNRVRNEAKATVRWGLGHALPKSLMSVAARRGELQGKLIAHGGDNPFPIFEQMRAQGPLYEGKFALVATSLPVVREVLSSNDFRAGFDRARLTGPVGRAFGWAVDVDALGPLEPPSLLVTEPPDHTRYRKLVTRVFTVRAVEKLRERTEQIAAELLDELAAEAAGGRGEVDLVRRYCMLLPVTVIAEILGVPPHERDRVLAFGEAAAPSLDIGLPWRRFRQVESALADFETWLGAHLATLREQPGEDLLSQLVTVREDGVGLDDRELKATAGLVLAAGFETTVNLLGNGIVLLREHSDQLATLLADPSGWPNAVEEILRVDPPVLLTGRTAVRDTEVAGRQVRAGTLITTVLAAANRDPDVFTDPTRFDVTRANAREHVSFSAGRHFCLGAALARMEGEVGLRALFAQYPQLATLPGATRRDTRILRGFATLPAQLGPRATAPVG